MTAHSADVTAALATLRERWGPAAPRTGDVVGALATVPLPDDEAPGRSPAGRIIGTGFTELDAILGPGGLPRHASVSIRGTGSSGRTTVALRLAAQAQAEGAIVAWLDFPRSFDPVEAAARGVQFEWLVVLTPESLDEGLEIARTLLGGRSVDLLLVDLPARLPSDARPGRVADRLQRLSALARRAETLLVVLEPPARSSGLANAVAETTGLRLELARRSWIRLGRDVVGQRTEVTIARNHFGPPGRRAELRILYADGGPRDACLERRGLLTERRLDVPATPTSRTADHATSSSLLAAPPPRPRPDPRGLRVLAGPDRPRGSAVDGRERPRHGPDRPGDGRSPRDAARGRAPARP